MSQKGSPYPTLHYQGLATRFLFLPREVVFLPLSLAHHRFSLGTENFIGNSYHNCNQSVFCKINYGVFFPIVIFTIHTIQGTQETITEHLLNKQAKTHTLGCRFFSFKKLSKFHIREGKGEIFPFLLFLEKMALPKFILRCGLEDAGYKCFKLMKSI